MISTESKEYVVNKHGQRKTLRCQMEFYFSDANLNRDKFMRQTISSSTDGFVPLELFLNFNKIRKVTTDVTFIAKALRKSKCLQLNENETAVGRCQPMKEIENHDDRTVYVEFLPEKIDHDWVKKIFSTCGKVEYVSLPKYPSSGDIKRFAFVEFSTVDEAQVACTKLNNPPDDAPIKPGKFPIGNKTYLKWANRVKNNDDNLLESSSNTEMDNPVESSARGQKRSNDQENTVKSKKIKLEGKCQDDDDSSQDSKESCDDVADIPPLRVIPKVEWLALKSEYVKLQKENMAKLKNALSSRKKSSKDKPSISVNAGINKDEGTGTTKIEEKKKVQSDGPEFQAGVIVKLTSSIPLTRKLIKDGYGEGHQIEYVDILDGASTGYLRMKDTSNAELLSKVERDDITFSLLTGDEEKNYWTKLAEDRKKKFDRKEKKKKKKMKPNTHKVFDD